MSVNRTARLVASPIPLAIRPPWNSSMGRAQQTQLGTSPVQRARRIHHHPLSAPLSTERETPEWNPESDIERETPKRNYAFEDKARAAFEREALARAAALQAAKYALESELHPPSPVAMLSPPQAPSVLETVAFLERLDTSPSRSRSTTPIRRPEAPSRVFFANGNTFSLQEPRAALPRTHRRTGPTP